MCSKRYNRAGQQGKSWGGFSQLTSGEATGAVRTVLTVVQAVTVARCEYR